VIEVPDPNLCQASPLEPQIVATRKALGDRQNPTATVQSLNQEVTISGVGLLGSQRKLGSGSFGSNFGPTLGTGIKLGLNP
jgi:hypothetical protein